MRYLWTVLADLSKEGIHNLVEFEPIEQQNIPSTHDRNTITLPKHITVVTQMVYDEPSMLYSTVNNDGNEFDGSYEDDALGMRFVDKEQAVSAGHKYSVSVGREYRVLKSKIDTWTIEQNKHRNLSSKFISVSISHLVANDPEIPISKSSRSAGIVSNWLYLQASMVCSKICHREGFW
ncbi:hypothetical protein M9H77_24232 [Catharanthus roseus]|uniref:Uncharacterized protein n=1 Tax=Catharanthus roseus TaxID=4058 RepID=A0ACC0AWJ2_CATRO|nr:hypothetical protein M9H77_24232 [Catharanthus roseus]